jgi:type 1 fimbria pilin
MGRTKGWLQDLLASGAVGLLLLVAGAPATAQTVNYSPATLSFSPAGPYSVPRDAASGSKVASALAAVTASGIACALIETATSVSGGYISGTISAPGNGPLPGIQANLVVTGQVLAGFSLSGLPSVAVTFTPTGSCSWSSGITATLATSASNSSVVPITCTVTTPTVSVNLPTASLSALSAFGKTTGDTRFPIGLSCASGATVYITLSDATTPANTSSLLTLAANSTAQGIKLRILNSAGPVDFGPDSAEAGTTHQWLLGASSSINGIPLTVQYYRDDTTPSGNGPAVLSAGSVHAQATFTMSYQ